MTSLKKLNIKHEGEKPGKISWRKASSKHLTFPFSLSGSDSIFLFSTIIVTDLLKRERMPLPAVRFVCSSVFCLVFYFPLCSCHFHLTSTFYVFLSIFFLGEFKTLTIPRKREMGNGFWNVWGYDTRGLLEDP